MSLPGEDRDVSIQGNYNNIRSPERARVAAGMDQSSAAARVTYKECLKNHAATMGGNVTDGCGEFMASGEEGTLEALTCAACSCHRNFHRKERRGEAAVAHPLHLPSPPIRWSPTAQPVKISFGGGGGTDSSSEELNFNPAAPPQQQGARKRFRTKFTAEQKEKMQEFAEKLGWRIPREDDSEVQRFCSNNGVKRHVFKVWMHNNKSSSSSSASKKSPQES